MVTSGVMAVKGYCRSILTSALANYGGFDEDNDPHGERDMGHFVLFDTDLYFKIDYYEQDLKFGSDDPADASITHRILTIMTKADF